MKIAGLCYTIFVGGATEMGVFAWKCIQLGFRCHFVFNAKRPQQMNVNINYCLLALNNNILFCILLV